MKSSQKTAQELYLTSYSSWVLIHFSKLKSALAGNSNRSKKLPGNLLLFLVKVRTYFCKWTEKEWRSKELAIEYLLPHLVIHYFNFLKICIWKLSPEIALSLLMPHSFIFILVSCSHVQNFHLYQYRIRMTEYSNTQLDHPLPLYLKQNLGNIKSR